MADLTITATSVVNTNAQINTGTAGEVITAGQPLYLKTSDSKLWKAKSSGTAEEASVLGIALTGAAANQSVAYAASGGTVIIGGTTVKTTTYVLSATAGGICPQADLVGTNRIVRIGHAIDTTGTLLLDFRNTGAVV